MKSSHIFISTSVFSSLTKIYVPLFITCLYIGHTIIIMHINDIMLVIDLRKTLIAQYLSHYMTIKQ